MTSSYPPFSKLPCSLNISSNHIMATHPKSFRREHSSKTIAIILTLKNLEKSFDEIATHLQLPKSIVSSIIHRLHRQKTNFFRFTKRADRSLKLNARNRRHLIRHVKSNPHDNFDALISLSKAEKSIHRNIVRTYLKRAGYFRFKARKKFYLTLKHKQTRLKWIKKHLHWTLNEWMHVIWIDESTFETDLNADPVYVIKKKDTTYESRYLKSTFKSERSTVNIWKTIAWNIKNSVHFLHKKERMNSEIYIHQVLTVLNFSFYDQCVREKDYMIYMNDETDYHTSKQTTTWKQRNELNRMNWSAQSSDLNPIENL